MVKPDLSRDYYGDLDLPPNADVADVKKQFKKLALKWHPDRNPGREAEVNGKFQIIQSAHEVLTDLEAKSKYDSSRPQRFSRYARASGVRGNPWQDATREAGFPPPPTRNAGGGASRMWSSQQSRPNQTSSGQRPQPPPPPRPQPASHQHPPPPPPRAKPQPAPAPTRPQPARAPESTSGAARYAEFVGKAGGAGASARAEDPIETRKKTWQAWEHMRPAGSRTATDDSDMGGRDKPPAPAESLFAGKSARDQKQQQQPRPSSGEGAHKAATTSSSGGEGASAPGPSARTARQRAQDRASAAFGSSTRRTGTGLRSGNATTAGGGAPVADDEPHSNRRQSSQYTSGGKPAPPPFTDPFSPSAASARRARRASASVDVGANGAGSRVPDEFSRPRAPYGGLGGEKTSLYGAAAAAAAAASTRAKSSGRYAVPTDDDENDEADDARHKPTTNSAGARRHPHGHSETESGPDSAGPRSSRSASASASGNETYASGRAGPHGGPSVYDLPISLRRYSGIKNWLEATSDPVERRVRMSMCLQALRKTSSEGSGKAQAGLNPFEAAQYDLINGLVNGLGTNEQTRQNSPSRPNKRRATSLPSREREKVYKPATDTSQPSSFSFNLNDDAFAKPATPNQARMSSSFDNINTRFVNHETSAYEFSAGNDTPTDATPKPRAHSTSRIHRPTTAEESEQGHESSSNGEPPQGFDASRWEDLGPHHFTAPQPATGSNTSPTRLSRSSTRKMRPVRRTMGSAGLVPEDSTSDSDGQPLPAWKTGTKGWRVNSTGAGTGGSDSPNAMDIDSPAAAEPQEPATAGAKVNANSDKPSVRTVPLEPSRPEWRAGDVNGIAAGDKSPARPTTGGASLAPAKPAKPAGSEDTEEFLSSFADLKKVEPLHEKATGIDSFNDLRSSLPFPSKAAPNVTLDGGAGLPPPIPPKVPVNSSTTKQTPAVDFPPIPRAPRPPPTVAVAEVQPTRSSWTAYSTLFKAYMAEWDAFNGRVLDHFVARQRDLDRARRSTQYAWLDAPGNAALAEYVDALQLDKQVRDRWVHACADHDDRVSEFVLFKSRMV